MLLSRLSPLTCAVTCARSLDSTIEAARGETGRQRVLVLLATDRQAPLTDLIQSTSGMRDVSVIHTSAAHSVLQEFVDLTGARPPPPHASCVLLLLVPHASRMRVLLLLMDELVEAVFVEAQASDEPRERHTGASCASERAQGERGPCHVAPRWLKTWNMCSHVTCLSCHVPLLGTSSWASSWQVLELARVRAGRSRTYEVPARWSNAVYSRAQRCKLRL